MRKRILLLFSDTGGGHRSAAEALAAALRQRYGAQADLRVVDVFTHYTPFPFNRIPNWYPKMVRHPAIWAAGFALTNTIHRTQAIAAMVRPYVRGQLRRLVKEHPADVYVSVHPLLVALVLGALGRNNPPFVTVVTDLVSVHAVWHHPRADLCIVPTEPARQSILRCGAEPGRIRVLGMPVSADFAAPSADRAALRARLGWSLDRPVVLLLGGGDGVGPVGEIAQAVAASGLECELVVVAGRNQALRDQLNARQWDIPVHIYGFVTTMPDFMHAADVLLTKAGTATICEAFCAALPTVIYSYIPGQETGNVTYAVEGGAGILALGPERTVETLRSWIGPDAEPGALLGVAANARRLARPNASHDIADAIWQLACAEHSVPDIGDSAINVPTC